MMNKRNLVFSFVVFSSHLLFSNTRSGVLSLSISLHSLHRGACVFLRGLLITPFIQQHSQWRSIPLHLIALAAPRRSCALYPPTRYAAPHIPPLPPLLPPIQRSRLLTWPEQRTFARGSVCCSSLLRFHLHTHCVVRFSASFFIQRLF
jgi:hypothetical protein